LIVGTDNSRLPAMQRCDSFEQAFESCTQQSAPGDVILLSPGCASYDWFRNFAHRGERFTNLAQRWSPT
jgi:UDP-N-acetylmuramoylalanine--D-glutamate ligase